MEQKCFNIMLQLHIEILVLGPPLGKTMWQANHQRKKLPVFIEVNRKDEDVLKRMKTLIVAMTQFASADRPSMEDVELELKELYGT